MYSSTIDLRKRQFDGLIASIIRYRWLIIALVGRDLKMRYRGSTLGFLWTFLNPLLLMLVYTLVFSVYFRAEMKAYPAFLLSGLLPWLWFATSVQSGTTSIIDGSSFVGKTVFPTQIIPLIPVLSGMVNYLLSLPILFIFIFFFHVQVGWNLLALPLIMIPHLLLILSVIYITSTHNVFYRDLQQIINHILTLTFFTLPIMYPMSVVPERMRPFILINPIASISRGYQSIFYYNVPPNWITLALITICAFIVCWLSKMVFDRNREIFAEYV
ncbi:MAG: ABC transporter permease [Pyrinomonadaceae bacterium]